MINVEKIKPTGLFTNYIYKAIPLAFDESMSYYETLCGLLAYLKDTVIPALNNNADAIIEVQNLMTQLQEYVDNYFDNLDVQEEINNKLDEMAESGQLTDIIAQYLQLAGVLAYNTVEDMKQADNLVNGSICKTLGYYAINDGGASYYKVRTITNEDIVDNATIIALNDETLIAELIEKDEISLKQLGLSNNNHNQVFITALNNFNKINIDNDINLNSTDLQFNNLNNKEIYSKNNKSITITFNATNYFTLTNCKNLQFKSVEFKANNHASTMIIFTSCSDIKFDDCVIDGNGYRIENDTIIRDDTKPNNAIAFQDCSNVIFEKSTVKNVQYRYGVIFKGCNDFKVINNHFEYIGGSAVEMSNSNNNGFIDNNYCYYCNITNLGDNLTEVSDGVIDTYGKISDETSDNNNLIISNNIINYYGNIAIKNSGIRVSGSKYVIVKNNIIKNQLSNSTIGTYIIVQDRSSYKASNVIIDSNELICDDIECFPSNIRIQASGNNIKITNNVFDSIVNYLTDSAPIIELTNIVIDCDITNNKIGNQVNLTKGVCISNNGSNVKISNNILNTTYRCIVCNNVDRCIINNNICNAGHNYTIQITGTSNNVKSFYNALLPNNGAVKIDNNTTNCADVGSFTW